MSEVDKSYERGQVVEIIQSVIEKMDGGSTEQQLEALKSEITELAITIEKLKKDIEQSAPSDVNSTHIPTATDELDAVIESTAEATNTIMTCCEKIGVVAETVGGATGGVLQQEVNRMFEACSFQDITGQRISKVVGALKEIDSKIAQLMEALHLQVGPLQEDSSAGGTTEGDAALMNGPQMADKAVTQDDIDALLAEFD